MEIPTLETERLVLRDFNHDSDFEPYAEFYASESSQYYGGPLDRESAWRAAAAMMGHWVIRGYGVWAVEEKSSTDFCGMVGLWNPEGWPEREISWAIINSKQRRGIANEAALRAREYAYETLEWSDVYSCIRKQNQPSIKLAEKLGATLHRTEEHPIRGTVLVYKHSR